MSINRSPAGARVCKLDTRHITTQQTEHYQLPTVLDVLLDTLEGGVERVQLDLLGILLHLGVYAVGVSVV